MQPSPFDQQIATVVAEYEAIEDARQQHPYYAQHIYPLLRNRFRDQPDPQSDVTFLLVTVSNPHVPVFAAAYWKPQSVFAIYSDYSQRFRSTIEQEIINLGVGITVDGAVVTNIEADPKGLYQAIQQAVQPYVRLGRENWHIALDVTGGTSVMSVGAAMAVSLIGGRLLYIPSDPRPDDPTKRQLGTERCLPFDDPYTVFGDLEAAEAHRHFQQHDYAVAAQLFGELAKRMTAPELAAYQQSYRALAELASMYAAWDVLDFRAALTHADVLLALSLDEIADLTPHAAVLNQQHAMLHELDAVSRSVVGRGDEAVRTLASADAMLPLLGTLHANALRRAAQRRYDFAALFRYRCLELLMQHRLATHGLLSNAPNYKALPFPKADLSMRFQAVQREMGRKQPRGVPDRITLFDGYMLLMALGDPLVRDVPIIQIEERSKARNTSVLAHGYRLIGADEYTMFAQVVDQVIDRLFDAVLHQSRDAWEQRVQFVRLPEEEVRHVVAGRGNAPG